MLPINLISMLISIFYLIKKCNKVNVTLKSLSKNTTNSATRRKYSNLRNAPKLSVKEV